MSKRLMRLLKQTSGLLGLVGLAAGLVLLGYGIGLLVENYGWDAGFVTFLVCGIVGILLFATCWRAKVTACSEACLFHLSSARARRRRTTSACSQAVSEVMVRDS
jgi:dipeptide/tripeptide permease